ncbi:MAG: OmpH family outer membrane protein [Flavobacterium sp.]|jgi:Skp family chaperone for outer membrane proteins|nr:OmpH family outer membrane protein [Flavobacterium sp.]
MRKQFLLFLTILFTAITFGQTKGVKIGYIDMEYILQNVPSYTEAKNQLELKAQKWKQEIEIRNNEITKLKDALKAEQVLLTKELIAEKQEEIAFQEKELLDYNQKRFGPNGDLLIQKSILVKPIQDQIFTIVQDLADSKKYDFIFDKSSDLTMLFASKRYDISEQVLRELNRAEQKEQLTKKQLKLQQEKDAREDAIRENPEMLERQKILDDKKLAREKAIAEKKAEAEEKKKLADEAKKKELEEKAAKVKAANDAATQARNKTIEDRKKEQEEKATAIKAQNQAAIDAKKKEFEEKAAALKAQNQAAAEARAKALEDKKKELEEKAAALKAQNQAAAEARAKIIEERKKELEERNKKIIEDREAAKKAREEKLKTKPIN